MDISANQTCRKQQSWAELPQNKLHKGNFMLVKVD